MIKKYDKMVLEFGTGSINCMGGVDSKSARIWFSEGSPREIGIIEDTNITLAEVEASPLTFSFSNIESLNALISLLTDARDSFKAEIEETELDKCNALYNNL